MRSLKLQGCDLEGKCLDISLDIINYVFCEGTLSGAGLEHFAKEGKSVKELANNGRASAV